MHHDDKTQIQPVGNTQNIIKPIDIEEKNWNEPNRRLADGHF